MLENNRSPNLVNYFIVGLLLIVAFLLGKLWTENQYLKKSAGVSSEGGQVQVSPTPPTQVVLAQEQWEKVSQGVLLRGAEGAQITLVEFSDFECTACAGVYPVVKRILTDYSDNLRLVFQHFPLNFHPLARPAAYAAECAAAQGKFWEYHDKIFENQNQLSVANLKRWAQDLGLDVSRFNSCLDQEKYKDKVEAGVSLGNEIGVAGTPSFYVNGKEVSWNSKIEGWEKALRRYIKAELAK